MLNDDKKRIAMGGGWPDAHMLGAVLMPRGDVGPQPPESDQQILPPRLRLSIKPEPGFREFIGAHLVDMIQVAAHGIDADPRPLVARADQAEYHDPRLLRMDANSRKYQSTQVNWRKFAGQHHKKKKIIK